MPRRAPDGQYRLTFTLMKEICHHPRQHASVRTAEPAQFLYTLISTPCGFICQKDGVGISMSDTNSPVTAVFIDADNTLWDTDGVFADAQLALLKELEDHLGVQFPEPDRLAFVRAIDQGLAERHHEGLRYPPRFLINWIGQDECHPIGVVRRSGSQPSHKRDGAAGGNSNGAGPAQNPCASPRSIARSV